MATVVRSDENVRRRASSSFLWTGLKSGDTLYRKDSVRIGAGGSAELRFSDGSILELGEDSLVIVDSLKLLALKFVRGSFILRSSEGDKEISVASSGEVVTKPLSIRLLEPAAARRFYSVGEKAGIDFKWETKTGAPGTVIEISSAKKFAKATTRVFPIPDGTSGEMKISLPPGAWRWRIGASESSLTETRSFRIDAVARLKAIAPDPARPLVLWGEESSVLFRWLAAPTDLAGTHTLQVAEDPAFARPIAAEPVDASAGKASLPKLPAGKFFWRIASRYPGLETTSEPSPLVIERVKQIPISPNSPEAGAALEFRPRLRLSWDFAGEGVEFAGELKPVGSDGKEGTGITFHSAAASYLWRPPAPGRFSWRVLALKDGQTVGVSPWAQFTLFTGTPIALTAPADGRNFYSWDKLPPVTLSWEGEKNLAPKSDKGGFVYHVRLARDAELREGALDSTTAKTELDADALAAAPGTWFWKVELNDETGRTVKSSRVSHFYRGLPPPLAAPALKSPAAGAVFNVVDTGRDPVVEWGSVDDARGYVLSVTQGGKVVRELATEERSRELKGLPAGKYGWSVRAVDPKSRKGDASPARELQIDYGKPLKAPDSSDVEVE